MPIIPDLRFEQTYLRSISPHLHRHARREQEPSTSTASGEDIGWKVLWEHDVESRAERKEKDMYTAAVAHAPSSSWNAQSSILHPRSVSPRMVRIDWGAVAWVTTRDQLISPLLQGALWGVASHFLRPFLSMVGAHLRIFFSSHFSPQYEGQGVGWLRSWIRGLMSGIPAMKRAQ